MNVQPTIDRVREAGVVAVLRGPDAPRTRRVIDTLVKHGITGIEVTYSTPEAPRLIEEVRRAHGGAVVVGAGTVRTEDEAAAAFEAGAQFLVAPGTDPPLVSAMLRLGPPVMSGALTPSEVMTATRLGVHVVKLFPASLGGPAYLRALRGPFPDVPFLPTGGVGPENLGTWLEAGAVAVGAGGELASTSDIAEEAYGAIADKARRFVATMRGQGNARP
ncbi:MAG: bifunctional 4-hydroxy-2-oxoglutarate aldolase/2-dehydro-3-deoxy-phosphogluconate aldolase [Streptosporangiaceae bacterium]